MMFHPRTLVRTVVSLALAAAVLTATTATAAESPSLQSSLIRGSLAKVKRNLTNSKNHEKKSTDPNYHSLFAPYATSVKAYCSGNKFLTPASLELNSSNGVFTFPQDNLLLPDVHQGSGEKNDEKDGNNKSASPLCTFVLENENLKSISSRMSKVLPTCRQLHTSDPSPLCVAVNKRVPLPPLQLQSHRQRIIYEMHLPTFSPDGTFDGGISRLSYLVELGITTIQLMPVNVDFDSAWGYSTAHLFAIKSELGGYGGLRRFIKAAHDVGLEVFMDVVYNHASARTLLYDRQNQCEADVNNSLNASSLPPATYCPSNFFKEKVPCIFGDYFYNNDDQITPWGPRFNYSSEQVVSYLMSNVKYYVEELGIDGLRFDAIICIRKSRGSNGECWQPDAITNEDGARFLRESTAYLSRMNRLSIAEDLQNDPIVTSTSESGLGFDAQWGNDLYIVFREAMRSKDRKSVKDVLDEIEHRCDPKNGAGAGKWISYTETHDTASSELDGHKRTAAVVNDLVVDKSLVQRAEVLPIALALVSCGTPMIFQGQELGEKAPFDYANPPPHDWDGFGKEWPAGLEPKEALTMPLCTAESSSIESSEKRKTYLNTKSLLQVFSRKYIFVSAGQDKFPFAKAALDFELEDVEGKKLLGVINFIEDPINADFTVPTPGVWQIAFDSTDVDAATYLQTKTVDNAHYIESFTIPPLAIILLEPVGDDYQPENISSSDQSQQCTPSFLLSIEKSDNLKFFNQSYWKNHVSSDLYPFWSSSDALGGDEYGNFPTYRCDDGTAYDKESNQCEEIEAAPGWITDYTDYDIAVQHSRQIFFYSVAYHMTGNSEMLQHAKAGVDVFFTKFIDGDKGAICTYVFKGSNSCLPAENERTSMEHANALIGLAMYFYITRDEAVGDFIFKSVDYTYSNWYREDWFMMGMANKTSAKPSVPVLEGEPLEHRKDMLAQLDQLNAYLMILRGISRNSEQWDKRMLDLALALKDSFWDEQYNVMWGNSNYKVLSSAHSDFGRTQKCLWFIMMTAEHLDDNELYNWAYTRAMRMIPLAWLPRRLFHNVTQGDIGTWAFDRTDAGASNSGHVWRAYAELSQTVAFMSVSNPSIASAVSSKAYSAYMDLFLDLNSSQKGVYHWKDYLTHETLFAKAHVWKNGFHEAEHALMAAISSAALQEQELRLYYAPEKRSPLSNEFYPLFFKGKISKKETLENDTSILANHTKVAIDWSELRNTDIHPDPSCLDVSCSSNGICFKGECLCLHGWTGPKCDVNPCENHITIATSSRNCDACTVTFRLNPSTIAPHPISKVMIAGSFSNWSAVEMELEQYDESSDLLYSELYPEENFYHGFSNSKMYSIDIDIPNGQHHTYKYVLDDSTWTNDKCNPDAVPDGLITADGIESKDQNSKFYVSCPPSGPICDIAKNVKNEIHLQSINEDVNKEEEQKMEDSSEGVGSGSVVQLFEWNYESVARECKRLGEEGWTAVQLSPINAHMNLGPNVVENYDSADFPLPPLYPWWERYQQASFNIMSRSGTEAELKAVTEVCAHHGVQVWVEVTLNSMNAAPCCDIHQSSASELPTCDDFFIDDSKSCSAERIFPTAGFDAGDLHSPPCWVGDAGTWGSPDVTHNCDMIGLPDLDTSSDHVQRTLAKYLDHLLDLGVSGFCLLTVGHIDAKEVEEILERSKNRIRRDIFEKTKARSMLPTLIVDLWPSWLVRFPHLQPSYYPNSMTPFTYNQLSSNAFNTDLAWSFAVGDTFYNKDDSPSLVDLTKLSTSTRFSHPMYKQTTDRIPLDGLILQLTNHFLTFYGVENCTSTEGTADVGGIFHRNVCPNVLSSTWDGNLLELGSIWMMSLPVGFTRIHSSYDWQRSFITNQYGRPFDTLFSSGPPRNHDGGTQSVSCDAANEPGYDLSPAFLEDGLRWMCEHRRAGIAAMPKWREEVARAGAYQLKLNEWVGNNEANDLFVSISRTARQGSNEPLKGGWIAINAHSTDTVTKQFAVRLPAGTYRNGASGSAEDTFDVDSRGILEATLGPLESIIIHTGDMTVSTGVSISTATLAFVFLLWLILPIVGYVWTLRKYSKKKDIVLKDDALCAVPENGRKISLSTANLRSDEETLILSARNKTRAMICTLEHIVPETELSEKINQKVGGLGKVMEVISKFHPGELLMVTPMMGGVSYPVMREAEPVYCEVEGKVEEVQIFHFRWPGEIQKAESIFCKHDKLFGKRKNKDTELYPDDSEDLNYFLRFFTLWNQTVAKLALRHRNSIDVLHLCDYHTSLAPTYMKREDENVKLPIICTLHNASYQGNIQNHLSSRLLGHISKISGLPEEVIFRDFTHDGQFNMLSGLVSYFRKEQKGRGFCAVSKRYAKEVPVLLDCFRSGMLKVRSLPNPELSINRPPSLEGMTSLEEIRAIKKLKKHELQKALDLDINPNAIIGAFVGRMVYQKGVDAIADAATELLLKHESLQLIVVGPPGDVFGEYAAARLINLARSSLLKGRIFVVPQFYMFSPDHRLGCDFALMPSRSEPFGFVDIEFAHCGCPVIGSLVGGLGKVPGWYFKLWEGGDFNHLKLQLSATVSKAIEEGREKILEVGIEGICTSFPLINWQSKLQELYQDVEEIVGPNEEECDETSLWAMQPEDKLYLVNVASERRGVSFSGDTDRANRRLHFKMEQNLNKKILTGQETNVESVFQSTVWRQSTLSLWKQQSMANLKQRNSSRLQEIMKEKLKEKVMGRTIETWIICILSILMPSHSTLIYAKAIVWASVYGWGENFIVGLYAVHTLAFALGCLLWVQIMQRLPIGKCVCISAYLHVVYFSYFFPITNYGVALTMSLVTGLISSSSGPVFTAAMFFDEWDGSLRSKVRNYGWLEGSRTCFSGIVQGLIIYSFLITTSPIEEQESDEIKFTFSLALQTIYGCVAVLTMIGAGMLYLGMKREMNTMILPRVALSGIKSFQAYPLLALSKIVDGLISYPTLFLVSWLLLDGYSAKETGLWVQLSSILQGISIFGFATLFNRYMEGRKCIGIVATFLINPVVLQALIMLSAPNLSSNGVLVLLTLSSFLIKLKEGLVSILKLHVLPSRWKVVTFSAYELFFTNVGAALSPFLIMSMANAMSLSLGCVGAGTSAEASALALFYTVLPFVAVSTALQLYANKYTFKDMPEVYTKPFVLNNEEELIANSADQSLHFTEEKPKV